MIAAGSNVSSVMKIAICMGVLNVIPIFGLLPKIGIDGSAALTAPAKTTNGSRILTNDLTAESPSRAVRRFQMSRQAWGCRATCSRRGRRRSAEHDPLRAPGAENDWA